MTQNGSSAAGPRAGAPKRGQPGSVYAHVLTRLAGGWSIRVLTALAVMGSMLVVAVVVVGLGWIGARNAMLETATRLAQDSGALVKERAKRMLEPAHATLRQLAFNPIAAAQSLDDRLAHLPALSQELDANPLISSLYVGYQNGEFLLVRALDKPEIRALFKAPARANFMVQARTLNSRGRMEGEYLFYNADGEIVARRQVPEYAFDPRTRGWFKAADATSATEFSAPYVFFSTSQVGVTLSRISRNGRAVVGIDVVLDDLAQALSELRMTPSAQVALINEQHDLLAYADMPRVLYPVNGQFGFKHVSALGEPLLTQLDAANPPLGQARLLEVDGQPDALGYILPFDVWPDQHMTLLVTAPVAELLGDLPVKRRRLLWTVLVLVALMLPLGWVAGGRFGRSLERLTDTAHRIGRFDFSDGQQHDSFVKEFNKLNGVVSSMSHTIQSFLSLSRSMANEPQVDQMLDKVLHQLVRATRCEAAAVYLWDHATDRMNLRAVDDGDANGRVQERFLAEFAYAESRQPRSLRQLPGEGLKQIEVELRGRTGHLQGLLVLVHAIDAEHAEDSFVQFAKQLSGMLAVSIETRQLIDAQRNLLDAVVRLMADAIDAKSPYTGGHCERVPEIATMLIDHMSADDSGPYAQFNMTDDQRYEFYLGAWLHDCGKVTSPEHIVDKATKLEVIYNRIHEVRMRFEVLWRDADIAHLKRLAAGVDAAESSAALAACQQQLQDDFAFVAQCNVGSELMAKDAIERLAHLASQTWLRHFDNRLGLAADEARRVAAAYPLDAPLPVVEHLLSDKPEHVIPWEDRKPPVERTDPNNRFGFDMVLPQYQQNMGEVHNLSIRRGTLTEEDRFKINDHIVQTYIMLKGLPWPQQMARVPEIAATHHERMDGKGYPRKLPAEQLTLVDRVMALADIFEALTAPDRPYKVPKTLNDSLRIMAGMCRTQHLDTELFRYFLHSGLWQAFAQRFLNPSQIDSVDVATIDMLLPLAPGAVPPSA